MSSCSPGGRLVRGAGVRCARHRACSSAAAASAPAEAEAELRGGRPATLAPAAAQGPPAHPTPRAAATTRPPTHLVRPAGGTRWGSTTPSSAATRTWRPRAASRGCLARRPPSACASRCAAATRCCPTCTLSSGRPTPRARPSCARCGTSSPTTRVRGALGGPSLGPCARCGRRPAGAGCWPPTCPAPHHRLACHSVPACPQPQPATTHNRPPQPTHAARTTLCRRVCH
jgi:hypothetical protein